jgi:hypothetical protein
MRSPCPSLPFHKPSSSKVVKSQGYPSILPAYQGSNP